MATPSLPVETPIASDRLTVALLGNPNTGKTTLFNALAGLRQRVGNYPGVTVETKKGQMTCCGKVFDVVDLPGTYSLAPRSPDEMVAVDLILGHQEGEKQPDVVVSIVDASNLERNLYLTTQALELGVPVVLALNMMDVAAGQGLRLDVERLAQQMALPVVPLQANKGVGLDRLRQVLAEVASHHPTSAQGQKRPSFPAAFEQEVAALQAMVGEEVAPYLVRRLLLDVGGYTEQRLGQTLGASLAQQVQAARQRLASVGCSVPGVEARTRYGWIREVTAGCVQRPAQRPVTWTDRLDRVLTHRLWGTLIFLVMMFLVFQSIFTAARPLMDWINAGKGLLAGWLRDSLPIGPLTSLLVDGVVAGVGGVLVFLPQILILFGFIALLEDCGYMARAAFLMDKLMSRCGLSGKSFIPMLSSVACAVPGIMATRVIEHRRDRLATILVAPLMSCSARLPVYILLIGAFLSVGRPWWLPGVVMFALYALGLVLAPLVALLLKRTLLRGETPVFVLEMPSYKCPSARLVLRRMLESAWNFLYRAGTLILASMIVVWALLYFPSTDREDPQQRSFEEVLATLDQPLSDRRDEQKEKEEKLADLRVQLTQLKVQEQTLPLAQRGAAHQQCQQLEAALVPLEGEINDLKTAIAEIEKAHNHITERWKQQSLLGRLGKLLEPVVEPLGWDWRIGVAALASFPAREVVVGTLGIIYEVGEVDPGELSEAKEVAQTRLARALQEAKWEEGSARAGQKVYSVPTALSLMVFFALCCQCASTLAVIRRETGSWRWPAFTFTYMTVLAYVGALVVYQVGTGLFG